MLIILKQDIINEIKKSNISYIKLIFTDLLGNIKGISYPLNKLNEIFVNYISIDGSNILGFNNVYNSTLYLKADLNSLRIIKLYNENIAVFFCDIYEDKNKVHPLCTRTLLKNKIKEIYPIEFKVGLEIEFYILDNTLNKIDNNKYLDILHNKKSTCILNKLVFLLEKNNLNVECFHHEAGASQYEISLKYDDVLLTCDKFQIFKLLVNELEYKENIKITLIPKLQNNLASSGLHYNCSVFKNGINLFESPNKINDLTLNFINGILLHSKEVSLIFNSTINSYKRLNKKEEVPKKINWSYNSRKSMIRVPITNNLINRIELRNIDSLTNIYFTSFIILELGLSGINKKLNIDLNNLKIKNNLPTSLLEAYQFYKTSKYLQTVLNKELYNKYMYLKLQEIYEFNSVITKWEIDKYL